MFAKTTTGNIFLSHSSGMMWETASWTLHALFVAYPLGINLICSSLFKHLSHASFTP